MINQILFGQTGHLSSRVIFGAFAVGFVDQVRANQILELLLEHGVNHIDTAPSYGESELRVGEWMKGHRDEFFLATKTDKRTRDAAYEQIQQSLNRLQTNTIDLLQLHNLVDPRECETALSEGGALEALLEAQKKGYVRHVGITGHGISVARRHLQSLHSHPFDAVLLPYNYEFMFRKEQYPADFEALYVYCQENGVAMQTIKSVARGRWQTQAQHRNTWYEPLEDQQEIDAAVSFVLKRPGIFLNSSGDPDLLPRTLGAASRYCAGELDDIPEPLLEKMSLRPLFVDSDVM